MTNDPWYRDDERRAEVNREGARLRAARWHAIVRFGACALSRAESLIERLAETFSAGARALAGRPLPRRADRDPWVDAGVWRELTPEDLRGPERPLRRRPWLDRRPREKW